MKHKHPHFKKRPILIGDQVKFQMLADDPKDPPNWHWVEVETIIQEEPGLLGAYAESPVYVGAGPRELFLTRKEAKKYGYDPDCTGWIIGHKPAKA